MSDDPTDAPDLSETEVSDTDIGNDSGQDTDIGEDVADADVPTDTSNDADPQLESEPIAESRAVDTGETGNPDSDIEEDAAPDETQQVETEPTEGQQQFERMSPQDILRNAEMDYRSYTDAQGRQMEVKLDSAYSDGTVYGADHGHFGLYHGGDKAGKLDMSFQHEPAVANQPEGPLKYTDARINYVEVMPEYQHAGNGTQLLNSAEGAARAFDAERITGFPENEQARQFFEAHSDKGWKVHDEGRGYNSITRDLKKP